ncbi:cytochrome c family protein [Stieleria sp. TO1_6]|uniref:cytochrome c family protein n=1 Tax=Stieleria tagensis TaxID=2956795 RepID=UPI00209B67CA|nr:cytochrome c family protein [Stieleria tagensis]MCO8120469.1 cytochrome c family protein [Stieleria tagensis]
MGDRPGGLTGVLAFDSSGKVWMPARIVFLAIVMMTSILAHGSRCAAQQASDLLWSSPVHRDAWGDSGLGRDRMPNYHPPAPLYQTPSLHRHPVGDGGPRMSVAELRDAFRHRQSADGGDPLENLGAARPHTETAATNPAAAINPAGADPHEKLWTEDCYPSAESCRVCHPTQYEQWRSSGHAYASVSPMFNRFEQAMTELSEGTVGSFCVRCHSPVQTQLKLSRAASILDAPPVVREGVTCIACHRVNEHYWRSNGDRRILPGNLHAPVYGGRGGEGVDQAIANADQLKLKLSPDDQGPGQAIHLEGRFFQPLTNSDVCASCHQVAVQPGIALEVVHAQYRNGPAAERGITCQQCHMGAVPGKPAGYELDFVAHLGGKPFGEKRKQSNHQFWGPGYSIAHPGIFPHNHKANQYTPRQWLAFDYQAGWGTEAFENSVDSTVTFPPPWDTSDDRRDGRKIIDANLDKLLQKRITAIQTMEGAIKIDGPHFHFPPTAGRRLRFNYRVSNTSEGHNLPTGSLGAQPQLWLNVALIDPDGCRIWESGYLDQHGDLADMNSVDVATHRIARDKNLFNLQTKFLINNVRGTDREVSLPLNFSLDQLVFLRPGAVPVSVLNHPPLIRMEAHSIPPLDHRTAHYSVPANLMTKPGLYRLSVRMRNRTEPMYFMRQINSTPDMMQRMLDNTLDLRSSSHTFRVQ